ncbi:MAG: sigma-70 family RNA polymerase sigma factor [Bacilli bacterium]|nr:sigma-70 family RNA polymerase sigma factor [Bacilli bacterium]
MIHQYNDSELLYLMYEEDNIALGILFEKYTNLIKKRLHDFRIHAKNYEDFFQEGLMMLYKAFYTYNPMVGKSFNKYFDMILQRKIIAILRHEKHYYYDVALVSDAYFFMREEEVRYEETLSLSLTTEEQRVFDLKYTEGKRAKVIAEILHMEIKKVYNVLYAIKQKLKQIHAENSPNNN